MNGTGSYLHHTGVWCRTGSAADAFVAGERANYDRLRVLPSDVVLDIGAHIGVVAQQVLYRGAAHLIAVEPYGPNVEMLRLNLELYGQGRCTIIAAAVVGEEHTSDFVELGVPAENFAMCSLVDHRAPYAVVVRRCFVPAVQFHTLLVSYCPTVLKLDIEAGEYALLHSLSRLPRHVRSVAIEWHNFEPYLRDDEFYRAYIETHRALLAGGYSVLDTSGAMVRGEHSAVLHIYERAGT